MFGLFRRKKVFPWEMDLLKNTLKLLPEEYRKFEKQIEAGLFSGRVRVGGAGLPGNVSFGFNAKIIDKFEDRKVRHFNITNIKVFDKKSQIFLDYSIFIASGVIAGYSLAGGNKFDIDVNKIDVSEFKKEFFVNPDYQKIVGLLTNEEKEVINSDEVYEVILNDKTYFHLKDLEDGDFIGMDLDKNIYEITHDPFEIIPHDYSIVDIFELD